MNDMQIRTSRTKADVNAAIVIDAHAIGSHDRANYIRRVAERGGLILAFDHGRVVGFCCRDNSYFFEKEFVSLLVVAKAARRGGIGRGLLRAASSDDMEIWTSTNRSNTAMRSLLTQEGWQACGELEGLDIGDPEIFFKKPR